MGMRGCRSHISSQLSGFGAPHFRIAQQRRPSLPQWSQRIHGARAASQGRRVMVFTWEDAIQIPQAQHVGTDMATKWLREVREMIKHHFWPSYNLTDTHADWRAFLAQHRLGREIVGLGVLHFEVHSLNVIPPHGPRFVFLVRRVDGTDAWVRPATDTVGFGVLRDWLPRPALAAPQGRPLQRFEPAAMLADPSPNIGRDEILTFLHEQQHQWRASV